MLTERKWISFSVLCCMLCLNIGCSDDSGAQGISRAQNAELRVADELVFPRVAIGDQASQTLRLSNSGQTTLHIESMKLVDKDQDGTDEFEPGDSWFETAEIEPGATRRVDVIYSPADPEVSRGRIRIKSNSAGANKDGIISVEIRTLDIGPQISSRKSLKFGRVEPGDTESKMLEIRNVGYAPLRVTDVFLKKSGGDEFSLTYPDPEDGSPDEESEEPPVDTLGVGESLKVRVRFAPDVVSPAHNTIVVASNAENQQEYAISLSGNTGGPCIALSPSNRIEFGPTEVGDTSVETITLENCSTDSPLEVGDIAVGTSQEPAAFKLHEASLPGELPDGTAQIEIDEKAHFNLVFEPKAAEAFSGRLLVESNDPARDRVEISVFGEGVPFGDPEPTDGPIDAKNDSVSTPKNNSKTIDVLANDSGPNGLAVTNIVSPPSNGTTTVSHNTVTYEPAQDFTGIDSFDYKISDGDGSTDTATVIVKVHSETGCECSDPWQVNVLGDACIRHTCEPGTNHDTTYVAGEGDDSGAYGAKGAKFIGPNAPAKPNGDNFFESDNDVETSPNMFNDKLDNTKVWVKHRDAMQEWIGFTECVDVPAAGTYLIGIGADNSVRFRINGNMVYERIFENLSKVQWPFKFWNVVQVELEAGPNTIQMEGWNEGAQAALGAEIYGPFAPSSVDTAGKMKRADYSNVIFSTGDFPTDGSKEFDVGESSGTTCSSGFAYDACGVCASGKCTDTDSKACENAGQR